MEILKTDGSNNEFKVAGLERTREDSKTLAIGEKLYTENKDRSEELEQKIVELGVEANDHVMTLMMEESTETEDKLIEIRLTLNGVMDAAGKDMNPNIALMIKDMLEGIFGLDDDSPDW